MVKPFPFFGGLLGFFWSAPQGALPRDLRQLHEAGHSGAESLVPGTPGAAVPCGIDMICLMSLIYNVEFNIE